MQQNLKPRSRNHDHETDYSQITQNIYVGSNLCDGEVCPVHGVEFEELKISTEINLSIEGKEIPPNSLASYSWIPVVDGYAPTQEQLDIGTSIIHEAVSANKNVYVLCRNGHGRSPTLGAAYLIRFDGKTAEEAEKIIEEKRPEIHIEKIQMEELKRYEKKWLK